MSDVIDRADPTALAPLARSLYAAGRTRRDVLETIYGVDLPREAVAFHEARRLQKVDVSALFLTHPWALLATPSEDLRVSNLSRDIEPAALRLAPSMIPLLVTGYPGADLGGHLIGYDIDELRAGRTTIVGSRWPGDAHGRVLPVRELGPSLLAVLHACVDDYCDRLEEWIEDPRSGYEQVQLDRAEDQLDAIEALQAELAGA